jgi:ribonuclease P protein component
MSFSFSKSSRLLKPHDFQYLKSKSKRKTSDLFVIYFKPTLIEGSNTSRLGISVSKKNGNAIFRNKIKRKVREAFRTSRLRNKGYDLLAVAKKNADFSSADINDDLNRVFECMC